MVRPNAIIAATHLTKVPPSLSVRSSSQGIAENKPLGRGGARGVQ